jgi:hypothetical protein
MVGKGFMLYERSRLSDGTFGQLPTTDARDAAFVWATWMISGSYAVKEYLACGMYPFWPVSASGK